MWFLWLCAPVCADEQGNADGQRPYGEDIADVHDGLIALYPADVGSGQTEQGSRLGLAHVEERDAAQKKQQSADEISKLHGHMASSFSGHSAANTMFLKSMYH